MKALDGDDDEAWGPAYSVPPWGGGKAHGPVPPDDQIRQFGLVEDHYKYDDAELISIPCKSNLRIYVHCTYDDCKTVQGEEFRRQSTPGPEASLTRTASLTTTTPCGGHGRHPPSQMVDVSTYSPKNSLALAASAAVRAEMSSSSNVEREDHTIHAKKVPEGRCVGMTNQATQQPH
ncbi:hypothetical protein N7539_007686 [Penicillium diatomitis]|uniref:Uncharacterized protein n=1 Tax=Penicillium diatomitis TaxID=2819901 RepID=A0A9W9WVZ0_9EURO|nr:uncharacterized protein N7539_007686 [Penicillium diatomitis]KAJ5477542.1 hypothetical protein N7539_007686 [Penicillium diatomitis]